MHHGSALTFPGKKLFQGSTEWLRYVPELTVFVRDGALDALCNLYGNEPVGEEERWSALEYMK